MLSLVRSNLFRNNSNKKSFHLSASEMHDECSASISVEFICFAVLVFKLLSGKVLFINRKDNRNCKR